MNNLVSDFIKNLGNSVSKNSGSYYKRYDDSELINHIESLSRLDFRRLVSNSYWNKYPTYSYTGDGPRSHGRGIQVIVDILCTNAPEAKGILMSYSQGLFLVNTLDCLRGKERVKTAKRAMKAKDSRVRLRAAKILPVSQLRKLSSDPAYSVRNMVIKRIGIDNCAEQFAGDKNKWIREQSIRHRSMEECEAKEILDSMVLLLRNAEKRGDYDAWHHRRVVTCLLKKLPVDDILYYMDLVGENDGLETVVRRKMISSNIDWSRE